MSQTLVIRTPDAVSTASRTFPKQGVFNLKITKNGVFDTVELWVRCGASNITLELAGASFQSTAQVDAPRTIPLTSTVISGSTLALTSNVTQYMKIKLNNGISVAHLRCSYTAKSTNATVAGGNIKGQAFVDYSKKPYISTSLERMFTTYPVRTYLSKWDISSVTRLSDMFLDNITFNQPIGNWNVSKVTNMGSMFRGATAFNQDLSSWNVSKVSDMGSMFRGATAFNQPIGNWDVSNATNMSFMFQGATTFNQPIGNWDVSNATNMSYMFLDNITFNQPIGNWDVSKVTNMSLMFQGATAFNQDLSSWAAKFPVNVNLGSFFQQSTWGTTNYDKFLNALWTDINTTRPQDWALRTALKSLGMGFSKYSAASAIARDSLVSNGWTITDGGLTA